MNQNILTPAVLICLFIGILAMNGCSKKNDTNNNSFSNQPEAKVNYDNQSGGVYKGTLTGSSGYFKINLQVTRPFIIYKWTDPAGNADSLFTNSLGGWISGQPITRVPFSGANGSIFWFSVNGNGTNPSIDSIYMPNHPARVYPGIAKETSVNQVKVYQGVAIPDLSNGSCFNAIVNVWTSGASMTGSFLGSNGNYGAVIGAINGNQVSTTTSGGNSGTLTISADGNSISGTIISPQGQGNCRHTINLSRIL